MRAIIPYNKRKSNFEKTKRDASFAVVSEHVILMCREYAKSNSISKAAKAGGFEREEVIRLLAEPIVIDTLEDEIRARSAAAKVSKEMLVNRLNTVCEALLCAIESDSQNIKDGKRSSAAGKTQLEAIGRYTEIIAKMNRYYEKDEAPKDDKHSDLLEARKNIFWGHATATHSTHSTQATDDDHDAVVYPVDE